MLTYQDFLAVGDDVNAIGEFAMKVVNEHLASKEFKTGQMAGEYFRHHDPQFEKLERVIYDLDGEAHKDIFTPDHKLISNFHYRFVSDTVSHLLGNGVAFDDDNVKKKLGGSKFDTIIKKELTFAANDGKSFGFVDKKNNKVIPFCFASDNSEPYYAPLYDEMDGEHKSGVRFWRISPEKPLWVEVYAPKKRMKYKETDENVLSFIEEEFYSGKKLENDVQGEYASETDENIVFPVVPLYYVNKQSSIIGNEDALFTYNLTLSGLANDNAKNVIYWILSNCEGMDETDDARFMINLLRTQVLHLEDGQTAEPHQLQIQFQAKQAALEELRGLLVSNYMGVDIKRIGAGSTTTVEIRSAYHDINRFCDDIEGNVREFIQGILRVHGIDEDTPFHFTRPKDINESEAVTAVTASAPYTGDDYTTKKLLEIFGDIDDFESIQAQKTKSESEMFASQNHPETQPEATTQENEPDLQDAIDNAEDAAGKPLNGAQMQSLITVIEKLADGKLTENQAVNVIATAIGITKEQAREIIMGDE